MCVDNVNLLMCRYIRNIRAYLALQCSLLQHSGGWIDQIVFIDAAPSPGGVISIVAPSGTKSPIAA